MDAGNPRGFRRSEARLVRLTPGGLEAWKAGLEPGETLSGMIRGAADRELERRRAEAELEAKRRAEDPLTKLLDR